MKILANDGIDATGKAMLEKAGFQVDTTKIPQENLAEGLKAYDVLTVRSATKVRKDIIDANPQLKVIGRGGVGMDNIDVEYAREKGIQVINTPASSSASVAELVIAHAFAGMRFLTYTSSGLEKDPAGAFNDLKKFGGNGRELGGKTMGIIGFGRIGQEVGRLALGLGMKVLAYDPFVEKTTITFQFHPEVSSQPISIPITTVSKEEVLRHSDVISMHVPFKEGEKPVIGTEEMAIMKQGAGIVNCARGGVVDEEALYRSLNSGHLGFAGLDVFSSEPPKEKHPLFELPSVSLTPHIGGSTLEAQARIGIELADKIISALQ